MTTLPFKPQYARNFDYFRVEHAMEKIGVAPGTFRMWVKEAQKNGQDSPNIYRMKGQKMVWGRFSEVEKFISENSEVLQ